MIQWLISRRYYLLTSLTLLLGTLVLVVTLALATASYLRSIDKTVAGYGHMLSSLDAALIHEMVLANQRQLAVLEASLDKAAIAHGEPADNPLWAIAHQIKRDSHYIYFYHPQTDRISSYPAWQQPVEYRAASRPWYRALSMPGDDLIWLGPYQEYGSDKQILTLIKRVKGLDGQLLGLLMVDMSFNAIQQALQRAMGRNQAAIYISSRGGEQLVVGCNMALYQPPVTMAGVVGSGLEVIWHGRHLRRELEGIDWDLNIYLPPELFHDGLEEALLMVVLPLLSLFAIWFCSINFLVRVFNQEQALVAGSLTGIVRDPTQTPCQLKTWFVHSSLSEIDQVRASFLQGQDALLHDPLTGIMNRRAFTQRRSELEESATPHWLLLFDVDNFKRINDNWGHTVGDGVLCRVAELLVAELGSGCVYRIGGDEFAALLPWPRSELESGLSRLLARVRNQQWREFREAVTLSVGGAHSPDDGVLLFERADECLYRSKRLGRDGWSLTERTRQEQGADRSCHMDNG
ncbi:GGDEF domain-containing protein [Aeromonas hydrophila]|uniref:GGDEF domain-containing protein n=1 Tax=Aeromonas hydrophila TaxID=644 RepID=UPI002B49BE7F|nr:GGDEF domain-containing protein [Aeromonas hydrophila]